MQHRKMTGTCHGPAKARAHQYAADHQIFTCPRAAGLTQDVVGIQRLSHQNRAGTRPRTRRTRKCLGPRTSWITGRGARPRLWAHPLYRASVNRHSDGADTSLPSLLLLVVLAGSRGMLHILLPYGSRIACALSTTAQRGNATGPNQSGSVGIRVHRPAQHCINQRPHPLQRTNETLLRLRPKAGFLAFRSSRRCLDYGLHAATLALVLFVVFVVTDYIDRRPVRSP